MAERMLAICHRVTNDDFVFSDEAREPLWDRHVTTAHEGAGSSVQPFAGEKRGKSLGHASGAAAGRWSGRTLLHSENFVHR